MGPDKKITYLNNSATSFPKPERVSRAIHDSMIALPEMSGRGEEAATAKDRVQQARIKLAAFLGCPIPERLIFTSNSSTALNQAIHGYVEKHYDGKALKVLTTTNDHNSVLRPLRTLEQKGIVELTVVEMDTDGRFVEDALFKAIEKDIQIVAINHLSNVVGTIAPLEKIGSYCRKNGIISIVDASQSAGLLNVDVETMQIDLLAITGHKYMFGPTGIGALYIGQGIELEPRNQGGTGVKSEEPLQPADMPIKFESGTVNYHGIVALDAARQFIEEQGREKILKHCRALRRKCEDGLRDIPGVTVPGPGESVERGAVVSFLVKGHDVADVDMILRSHYRVIIRSGLHCAPLCHEMLGTFPEGTLRASFSFFNTEQDVDALLNAVSEIARS